MNVAEYRTRKNVAGRRILARYTADDVCDAKHGHSNQRRPRTAWLEHAGRADGWASVTRGKTSRVIGVTLIRYLPLRAAYDDVDGVLVVPFATVDAH